MSQTVFSAILAKYGTMDLVSIETEFSQFIISLITATHFRAIKLSKMALPSVLQQTSTNFEWIVVNDGKCSRTRELIQASSYPFKMIYREMPHQSKGFGLCHARNWGLAAASGDLIAYLDDDNSLYPDFIKSISQTFAHNPGVKCCFPRQYRCRNIVSNGVIVKAGKPFISPNVNSNVFSLIEQKELFDSNGFVHVKENAPRWNPEYRIFCDYEYLLQCVQVWGQDRIRLLSKVLVNYLQSSEGVIGQSSYLDWVRELNLILQNRQKYQIINSSVHQLLKLKLETYQARAHKNQAIPAFKA